MLRETIRNAKTLRNGNGRRPQARSRSHPRRAQLLPPTHAEQLRAEIPSLPVLSELAPAIHRIADELNSVEKPRGTTLTAACPKPHILQLDWENIATQHCITMIVDLRNMDASYEYSMVCEADDELKPFPQKPLGSNLPERTDLNLNRKAHWTWLAARIGNTRRPTRG